MYARFHSPLGCKNYGSLSLFSSYFFTNRYT
jgi:amino acid transporter